MTVKSKPSGRFEWEKSLRDAAGLSLPLRGVLLTLATYSTTNTGGDIRPSVQRLSRAMGVSRSTVNQHIKSGIELGWLSRVDGRAKAGQPSVYALAVPLEKPDTPAQQAGQGCPPEAAGVSAEPDRTMSVTKQGPLQEVPSATDPDKPARGFRFVELATIQARRLEAEIQAEIEDAPPFD